MSRLWSVLFYELLNIFYNTFAYRPPISYQIHSNNDLNEWPQLLLKGVTRFKVDPHFTASDTSNLFLNHDTPYLHLAPYNTTNELIDFLASNDFGEEKIKIALCFKAAPDLCNESSSQFKQWLALVDLFHERALRELSNKPIEFILDGLAKPQSCLVGKWLPWVSVWISTEDPQEAFWSNSKEYDYYRYQILNDNENQANWTWMAQVNYGKFSSLQFPLQLWEPDAQQDYADFIYIYQNGTIKTPQPGFLFAINTDLAMFQIYSSIATKKAENDIDQSAEWAGANYQLDSYSKHPFIASLDSYDLWGYPQFIVISESSHDGGYLVASLISRAMASDPEAPPFEPVQLHGSVYNWLLPLSEGSEIISVMVSSSMGFEDRATKQRVVLSSSNSGGRLAMFSVKSKVGNLSFSQASAVILGCVPVDLQSLRVLDIRQERCTSSVVMSICAVVLSFNASSSSLVLNHIVILIPDEAGSASSDLNVFIDPASTASYIPLPDFLTSSSSALVMGHVLPADSETGGLFVFLSCNNFIMGAFIYPSDESVEWKPISVGERFSINAVGDVLMLVSDHGYCYNSHAHNTRSFPSVCASPPVPTPYVLTYSVGLVQDWRIVLDNRLSSFNSNLSYQRKNDGRDHRSSGVGSNIYTTTATNCSISSSGEASCFLVSPCHRRILHGAYDQGSRPTIALGITNETEITFFEAHDGFPTSARDIGSCGLPLGRDGIVADSFDISLWVKNLV